ncbi:RAMP superfamily CRISPR-associated protein [Nocardia abscessus]|uniref:RAMP superfamily CRISPR-associated protein n=1 Tax=Nocardia abscessus TaxID=120957 RepID=UPI0024560126|nr:RAMP superfamily CRISPR-associated protein [Nocardia abscessus]
MTPPTPGPRPSQRRQPPPARQAGQRGQPRPPQPPPVADDRRAFLNPYNFIATPHRPAPAALLGDRSPIGHADYAHGTYSGAIAVTLTARTPLLLVDHAHAAAADETNPKRVGTRRTSAAAPLLNGSTVKGMLRSAFEAITNSRYGVVSTRHDLPVATRQDPSEVNRKNLKPAIVLGTNPTGDWVATAVNYLRPTDNYPFDDKTTLHPAPWVPTELGAALAQSLGLAGVEHLDNQVVEAWIHLQEHPADDRGRRSFGMWRVSDIAAAGRLGDPTPARNPKWTVRNTTPVKVRGRLHWTHSSFPAGGVQKHDERLVVDAVLDGAAELVRPRRPFVIPAVVAHRFAAIIDSYRRAHETETELRKYGSYVWDPDRWKLRAGRTLYIEFAARDSVEVVNCYPAVIGREPFHIAPADLIDQAHAPATDYEALSPADRVFGWVHPQAGEQPQAARTAHRSALRVDPPECVNGADGIRDLHGPVELGALNTPKTVQYRFYTDSATGYDEQTRLRGRKTYLPHRDTLDDPGYWKPRGGTARTREYLAAEPGTKPKIKTAITSWVPIGTVFRTTLWVHNLTETELAALLWLLTLPEQAVYGIGLGKPLGFGAATVAADLATTCLHTHTQLRHRYQSLTSTAEILTPEQLTEIAEKFIRFSDDAGLAKVRRQFLESVTGFDGLSVHYPRLGIGAGTASAPTETSYEWFVANNDQQKDGKKPRALPELAQGRPPTLPYLRPRQGRHR